MDLQSVFYLMSIIFMMMWIVILILISAVLWSFYNGIKNAPKRIEESISNLIESNKSGLLGMASVTVGTFLINRVKKWISK